MSHDQNFYKILKDLNRILNLKKNDISHVINNALG
jgi:hypothetical protein